VSQRLAKGWWTGSLWGAALIALAVICGRAVVETQAIDTGTGPLVAATAGVLAAVAVMVAGPVVCVAALVGLSMVPLLPTMSLVGDVELRPADAFYVPLVLWATTRLLDPGVRQAARPALRATPIILFVGFAGLSLLYVMAVDPGGLERSVVSWLRFAQTISIAFLAALFIKSTADVRMLLAVVAIAGAVAIVLALTGGMAAESESLLGPRGGGKVNPNALGLISGMLVLMAFLDGLGSQLLLRIALGIVGVVGLVQSQSLGAMVGTCVALTLGMVLLHAHRENAPGLRGVRAVAALVVALALAYGAGSAVAPEKLPSSDAFYTSSAWHRTVVGAAGVELVERHPIIGVGWRRSSSPDVIGDPALTTDLRATFSETRNEFFPDVEPTSVHNTYVQIAAELGLVGLALLGVVLVVFAQDIRRLLRRVPRPSLAWTQLWYLSWAVVLALVWLNDNPLFGGQAETVLLSAFVGAIAGLGGRAASVSSNA
jgi:O-antigen ligase